MERNRLVEYLCKFDKAGKTVKIHCTGGGAVRYSLDAIAQVRQSNGPGEYHEIAHCTTIDNQDKSRFAQLGVGTEMSPTFWHLNIPGFEHCVGENTYEFASIRKAGAHMTIGSDLGVVESGDKWGALQGIVERNWNESTDLAFAIEMLTINGAKAARLDHTSGLPRGGQVCKLYCPRSKSVRDCH